jgi:hypothetical protein
MPGTDGTTESSPMPDATSSGYPMPGTEGSTTSDGTTPPAEGTPAEGYPTSDSATSDSSTDASGQPQAKPKTLKERSLIAFHDGKEDEAFQLLSTHYVLSPDGGAELAERMQWIPQLRRPALAPRIGVVVKYKVTPPTWDGDPQPIGSEAGLKAFADATSKRDDGRGSGDNPSGSGNQEGSGRRRRRPAGAEGGENPKPASPAEEDFIFFTGEFGAKMLAALRVKIAEGVFGQSLKEAGQALVDPADPNNPSEGSYQNPSGTGEGQRPDGFAVEGQLTPGVTYLGMFEDDKELAETIQDSPVDVILEYDVAVRASMKSPIVNNDTKLRIVMAKKPEILFNSAQLNNRTVLMEREKGTRSEDPVDKEVGRAMAVLEEKFKLVPLPPALTSEVALKRIGDLAKEKPEDPLPMLLEARYYVAKDLMTQDDLMALVVAGVGEEKIADIMSVLEGADLKLLLGKASEDPELAKLLEGQDPAKLLELGGKLDAGGLLEAFFPKTRPAEEGDKPADGEKPVEKPADGEKPAETEKPAAAEAAPTPAAEQPPAVRQPEQGSPSSP